MTNADPAHVEGGFPLDTGNDGGSGPRFLPQLRSRWWTLLLGASLMFNLLVGGLAIGHRFRGDGMGERLMGASFVQLVPRKFFFELPRERRRELLKVVRDESHDFRRLRTGSSETAMRLADVLESPAYSAADMQAAVNAFSVGTESLAARSGTVASKLIGMLTPEERKLLAISIRERRADGMGKRGRD